MEEENHLLYEWRSKICLDNSLSSKDKLTAFVISMFVDEELVFIPNIKIYSKVSNLYEKTIARSFGNLEHRGYIRHEYKNIYYLWSV